MESMSQNPPSMATFCDCRQFPVCTGVVGTKPATSMRANISVHETTAASMSNASGGPSLVPTPNDPGKSRAHVRGEWAYPGSSRHRPRGRREAGLRPSSWRRPAGDRRVAGGGSLRTPARCRREPRARAEGTGYGGTRERCRCERSPRPRLVGTTDRGALGQSQVHLIFGDGEMVHR